jgi:tRNA threonylcarbamoyladenosine biosynthesis protein TsaB
MTDSAETSPWLLAIDTSTEQAGLALTDGNRFAETSWFAGREQTVSVLAQIDHLVELTGIDMGQIKAIGVATGPGTFNGLRVGLSLAKGLHVGLDAVLIGVSTLMITAQPFLAFGRPVVGVVAAGRGRLVWDVYPEGGRPVNGTVDDLAAEIRLNNGEMIIVGDLTADQASVVESLPNAVLPSPAIRTLRPAALAEIAWERFLAQDVDDPALLAPVYVHARTPGGG